MAIPTDYVSLPGSERALLPGAQILRPADPNEPMQVTLMVRPLNPLVSRADQSEAPARHLTRAEYRTRHAATPEDLAKVQSFAAAHNLRVNAIDDVHRSVKLTGTVGDFSRAFAVELHRCHHPDGDYRGRTGAIHIPRSLDGIVTGVFGLDDRPAAEPRCGRRVDIAPAAAARGAVPSAGTAAGTAFTPPQLALAYNFPATLTGAGQTIGIIELAGGIDNSDLAPYFGSLGLPVPAVSIVSVDSGRSVPNRNDNNATLEVMLDIEVAGAVAPQAKLAVYFAPNTEQSFLNAVNTAVNDSANDPSVISISWGKSEDSWTSAFVQHMDQILQAAAELGVTVCCASGDNGSADGVPGSLAHVDFPSSSPSALACGGTSLSPDGSEVAWNNGPGQISGGGISDVFPVPAYQNAPGIAIPASANPGGGRGRGVPDVSAHAANYVIRLFGTTAPGYYGTSAVAPLWAGLFTLVNQSLAPRRAGLPHPALYQRAGFFHDIVTGGNGAYSAASGWDACTGLGSPIGAALIRGFWHTLRGADGSWSGLEDAQSQISLSGHAVKAAAASGTPGETRFLFTTADGHLWHAVRQTDGTWSGPEDAGAALSLSVPVTALASAAGAPGETRHLLAAGDGHLWHTARQADGSWSGIEDAGVALSLSSPVTAVAGVSGVPGDTQFLLSTGVGHLMHTVRHADGTWSGLTDAAAALSLASSTSAPVTAIAAAAGNAGETQFMFTTGDGSLWHAVRRADGAWQALQDAGAAMSVPGPVVALAGVAGVPGETQFILATTAGRLWHSLRHSDGSWTALTPPDSQFRLPAPPLALAAAAGTSGETGFLFSTIPAFGQ